MFQSTTSILTMSAMLLHSIFGCCSHHAHACEHGHMVETCQPEDGEHAGDHHGHDGCSGHSHAVNDVAQEHVKPVSLASSGRENSAPDCPHDPCQHDCSGGDCRFTQTSQVKTPTPDDVECVLSGAFATVYVAPCNRMEPENCGDAGPPGRSLACCYRPLLQVWRI